MLNQLRRRGARAVAFWMIASLVLGVIPAPAQVGPPGISPMPPPSAPEDLERPAPVPPPSAAPAEDAPPPVLTTAVPIPGGGDKLISLNFRDAPLDQVLTFYAEITGRTLIKSPGINATITLRGQTRLTEVEALQAIESVLAMNNVTLVPMGEKFLKIVQPTQARQEAMPIVRDMPGRPFPETDQLISQILTLKYLETSEATTIIQGFVHGYGKIQALERAIALLITDTAANLQRISEILDYLDQPTESRIETRVYELKYAEAAKIASRLNELIQDAQAKEEKPRVATIPTPVAPSPPGIIRARPGAPIAAPTAQAEVEEALAERGIVQGKVKIVADERTNILIVISRPSNFAFFDKIVAILDRPVEPDILVRVLPLEYAKAEEIAGILNEFIGAAKSDTSSAPGAPATPEPVRPGGDATTGEARSRALQDYVAQRAAASETRLREAVSAEKAKIGELSPNTKILADKRTNSLLLMGTKGDLAALEEVIDRLDTMLAQVIIEAVILEVNLSKNLSYGLDWMQRSMTAYDNTIRTGPGDGVVTRQPLFSFGGGQRADSASQAFTEGSDIGRGTAFSPNLTYFATIYDLNMDVIIRMAAASANARILSMPKIMTTDNTEAKVIVGEQRPVVTSTSVSSAGQQTSSYEYRNIGINLTVTPRINPQRYVVMEITQTADNVGDIVKIDNNDVPVITKREMSAQIAVRSRETIVLGGLVDTAARKSRSKIPILGDIPLIGTLFRADSRQDSRTELLVLLTPYVLMTPEEARRETERLHRSTEASNNDWARGWSDSRLARPTPKYHLDQRGVERAEAERQRADQRQRARNLEAELKAQPRVTVVSSDELRAMDRGTTIEGEPIEIAPLDDRSEDSAREEESGVELKIFPKEDTPSAPEAILRELPVEEPAPAGQAEAEDPYAPVGR